MPDLGGLWGLGEDSFRTLLTAQHRLASAPRSGDAAAGATLVAGNGDGLCITRAVEIELPATDAWPWLAQLCRGAGIYGWPALESGRWRSAEYLLDGLPCPRVGDRCDGWMELVSVEPGAGLAWRLCDSCTLLGHAVHGLKIEYALSPLGPGRCCLRSRVGFRPTGLTEAVTRHLCAVVDFIMPSYQLPRLKRVAESYAARPAVNGVRNGRARLHQPPGFVPAPGPAVAPEGSSSVQAAS